MSSKVKRDSAKALLEQLKNPFDPKFVKWRVGATSPDKKTGIALAYLDAREVTKRLDQVLGIENWRDKITEVTGGFGFISEIQIKFEDEWIGRSDASGNTQVEPVKGGASGAFKRAAAKWGVGRYLYYLKNVWVPIVPQGKSYVLVETPKLPNWALPGHVESWEDVAELELAEDSAGMDEQQVEGVVVQVLGLAESIRNTETTKELESIVDKLSGDQQRVLVDVIQNKTQELIDGDIDTTEA